MKEKDNFHFYGWGLSDKDEIGHFHLPKNDEYVSGSIISYEGVKEETIDVELKSLDSIMKKLGHKELDLLKLDIEGSEFAVIDEILASEIRFNELCLEIHNRYFKDGITLLKNMIKNLNNKGYYIANIADGLEKVTFIKQAK